VGDEAVAAEGAGATVTLESLVAAARKRPLDDGADDDEDDIDDEEVEGLFDDLRESLDMFKRFTKYN
jgi:hypothetical protein